MIESFVNDKIETERSEINKLIETIPDGNYVTRVQILNSDISDFTKNYLLYEFNEELTIEELNSQISKANKLRLNYTIRPKWTLQTFLFNNFESRPPNEIVRKLNLFTFYSFYTDSIKDFITDNFQIFMTKGEATSIIDSTNLAILEKLTNEINNAKIKNFFLQIFLLKYNEESKYNLESSIPFLFIKIFLIDKSFNELLSKFDKMKDLKDESEISLKDIIKILTDKYTDSEKQEQEKEPVDANTKATTQHSKSDTRHVIATPVQNVSAAEREVKKPVQSEKQQAEEKIPLKKTELKPLDTKKEAIGQYGKDKKIENNYSKDLIEADKNESISIGVDKAAESGTGAVKELKDLFNEKQLDKILDKVYGSDLIYQEKSFNKLIHYKTWSEASNHLKEIFNSNKVDLYNKDVVTFVNILNDHYKKKEK